MKKIVIWLGSLAVVLVVALYCFWILPNNNQLKETRVMTINPVNLAEIAGGTYVGSFTYSKTTVKVEVEVVNHQINSIQVLEGPETKHALLGRQVIGRVLAAQTLQVDVVSGATTTSKATLKAIERALTGEK